MTETFQIGNKTIRVDELLTLLGRYQLLPQLLRGLIIDEAIADYTCTEQERSDLLAQFYTQNKLESQESKEAWLQAQGMTETQLEAMILRPVLLEKFKVATWGAKVESYFMTRKPALDRMLYSLIRTKDLGTAQELYFRIQEGEKSFSEIAREYSQGSESNTGGLIGPVTLNTPHPAIAKALSVSQPGQLWPPTKLEDWYVIIRLEKFFPAQMDDSTRRQLIDEMFETWLRDQMQQTLAKKQVAV
jgi:parvulin-like peptidyl-prolyl isomerase